MNKTNLFLTVALIIPFLMTAGCSDDEDSVTTSGGGNNGSLGDSTPTGRITADGFFVLYTPGVAPVFDSKINFIGTEVIITAFADDVNDLVIVSGQTVNFATEWGTFLDEKDSCVLDEGQCSVVWRSGDPGTAPGSCRVAITAWTTGEEFFFDENDNGLFDSTESFFRDLQEPFLDINGNGSFDSAIATAEFVGEIIDIINFDGTTPGSRSGDHDLGNGLYDGSLCASGNSQCNTRTSMIIHTRSTLLIQEPFADADDLNGNGNTEEEINFCGFNFF